MLIFTILVYFCLLTAFITISLGVFVYAKNPRSPINRQFIAVMLTATYWALGEFFIWHTGTYEGMWIWLKFSSLWPFVVAFTAHFLFAFTGHSLSGQKRSWILVALLYVPAAILSLLGFLTTTIFTVVYVDGPGWVYIPVPGSIVYYAEVAYSFILIAWVTWLAFSRWRTTPAGNLRQQCRLVSIGLAIIIIFGTISGVILPLAGIYAPNLVFVGTVIFALIITHAILRYGLFILSPETAVPDIIRAMPDGLLLVDMSGKIISANSAASGILGVEEGALPGSEIARYLPHEEYHAIRNKVVDGGIVTDVEAVLGHESPLTVSIAGAIVRDPGGDPAGIVVIIRDITVRKQSERTLRIANQKISLLTELTRHDISNLVTALSAYLELIQQDRNDPSYDSYLASCIQLVDKIGRHLKFTREYQDIGSSQPTWQVLEYLVNRAVDDVPHEGIGIITHVGHVEVFSDPLVVRVISNLLDNAIRHGEDLTSVRIWTEEGQGGELLLVFEDDGVGIPNEEKENIFLYGYGKHTGLGLAISRDILSMTRIIIRETGKPGEGARFEIHVPPGSWRYLGK
ncbi:MAG: histidine kinase N-terminal 7TM domain-containing protein [Methanolinea sp.]